MANWGKLHSRGSVEDRRGLSGAALGGGGLGIAGIVIYLLVTFLGGGDPVDVINVLQNTQIQEQNIDPSQFEGQDSYEVFVSTVLGSTNDMWSPIFSRNNLTYTPPRMVLFRGATQSACGGAISAIGPHYCPIDETIYLDETFFEELARRLGAQGGDVAEAYVIAHEVGHHAQNLLGITDNADLYRGETGEDSYAVAVELQADCFAGLWAYSIKDIGVFESGEIREAIDAAAAVGDDRIQKMQTGHVSPESWTHGSSAERVSWFMRGFDIGDVNQCDTFR
jgi:uncharacterized protein